MEGWLGRGPRAGEGKGTQGCGRRRHAEVESLCPRGEGKSGRGACALRSVHVEVGTREFLGETEKHHSSHAESKEGEESVASLSMKASVTATQSGADERGALRGRRWALRAAAGRGASAADCLREGEGA